MEEEEKRSSQVSDLKFSRDRSKLAIARKSGQVEMWTVSNWECHWSTQTSLLVNYRFHLTFSADDSKITCKNDEITVLDAESGEECDSEDTFDFCSTNDHVHIRYVS